MSQQSTTVSIVSTILTSVNNARFCGLLMQGFLPSAEPVPGRGMGKVTLVPFIVDPFTGMCDIEPFLPSYDDEMHDFEEWSDPWAEDSWEDELDNSGITAEDMAEFRARNIERGTAAGYWY